MSFCPILSRLDNGVEVGIGELAGETGKQQDRFSDGFYRTFEIR
jgi:hypothetical protein